MPMPQYDLSTIALSPPPRSWARVRANQEPSQDSYNAAWLHGYAQALFETAEQLQPQQELLDAMIGYMGQRYDSAELYAILHDCLGMSGEEIQSLGFDLPQCANPKPKSHETQRRNPPHER